MSIEYTKNDEKLLTINTAMILRPVDQVVDSPRTFLAQEQHCYTHTVVKKFGCGSCPGKKKTNRLFYVVCIDGGNYHLPAESIVVMDEIIPPGEFGQDTDERRREFGNTLPNGERVIDYSPFNHQDDPQEVRRRANIVIM